MSFQAGLHLPTATITQQRGVREATVSPVGYCETHMGHYINTHKGHILTHNQAKKNSKAVSFSYNSHWQISTHNIDHLQ